MICEIMNDDGTMARLDDLVAFSQFHNLKIGSIADLIAYKRRNETLVDKIYTGEYKSHAGTEFQMYIYAAKVNYAEHIAIVKGDITNAKEPVLVRMHAVDILQDILGSNTESTIQKSIKHIEQEECGVLVILRPPNPKGLSGRLTGEKQEEDQALRDYGIGAQVLRDIGVRDMKLLTNSPKSVVGLDGYDLHVHGYVPIDKERN